MKFSGKLSLLAVLAVLVGCLSIPVSAASGTQTLGVGFVTASALRLRAEPSTSSETLATAYQNECIVVLAQDGDWYRVLFNLQEGYMYAEYLDVKTARNAELGYGKVTGSGVNVRSGPGTSYSRITTLSQGDTSCYIIGINNGWYKVITGSQIGYIRSDYLELTEYPYENRASSNSPKFFRTGVSTGVTPSAAALNGSTTDTTAQSTATATGSQILAKAQQYLGTPYVYGGASPSGFDCSGLVYYVLKELGYSPARTPAAQYSMGTAVSYDELQPGDIVFFSGTAGSGITHVGIYAGNGQFIHSPNSRSTVSYSSLTSGYWLQHYYGARRVGA